MHNTFANKQIFYSQYFVHQNKHTKTFIFAKKNSLEMRLFFAINTFIQVSFYDATK